MYGSGVSEEPAAPDPTTPVNYWQQPEASTGTRSRGSRIVAVLAWVFGIAAIAILLVVSVNLRLGSDRSAFAVGRAWGEAIGFLVVAIVVWLLVRRARGGRLSRTAGLVLALLAAGGSFVTATAQLGPSGLQRSVLHVDPALAITFDESVVLATLSPSEVSDLEERLKPLKATGALYLRDLFVGGEYAGRLIAADLALPDSAEFISGIEEGAADSGWSSSRTTIGGYEAVIIDQGDSVVVDLVEPPLLVTIISLDRETALQLAEWTAIDLP